MIAGGPRRRRRGVDAARGRPARHGRPPHRPPGRRGARESPRSPPRLAPRPSSRDPRSRSLSKGTRAGASPLCRPVRRRALLALRAAAGGAGCREGAWPTWDGVPRRATASARTGRATSFALLAPPPEPARASVRVTPGRDEAPGEGAWGTRDGAPRRAGAPPRATGRAISRLPADAPTGAGAHARAWPQTSALALAEGAWGPERVPPPRKRSAAQANGEGPLLRLGGPSREAHPPGGCESDGSAAHPSLRSVARSPGTPPANPSLASGLVARCAHYRSVPGARQVTRSSDFGILYLTRFFPWLCPFWGMAWTGRLALW